MTTAGRNPFFKRLFLPPSAVLLAAACAAPRPCTRALCPTRLEGAYRVGAWNSLVTVSSGTPLVPIVSDSSVEILSGQAEFVNNGATLKASAGTSFHFEVAAPPAVPTPVVAVSSGAVIVQRAPDAAPETVAAGSAYFIPVAR